MTTTADRFYANNDMTSEPPELCEFKVGSRVMFENDYGLVFGPFEVIGFTKPEHMIDGRFVHINSTSPWFPVIPDSLYNA